MALRSFSFSGSGFLGSYHVGVACALRSRGLLPDYTAASRTAAARDVTLVGASAGALVSAGVMVGADGDEMMEVVSAVAVETAKQPLDALTPGYSLIDALEPHLRRLLSKADPAEVVGRAKGRLRVVLTTPGVGYVVQGMRANRVVDEFADVEHLTAACLLSSFVPGVTGPLRPAPQSAAGRAAQVIDRCWGIKRGSECSAALSPVAQAPGESSLFLDGGFTATWPVVDEQTVLVSSLAVRAPRDVICPVGDFGWTLSAHGVSAEVSGAQLGRVYRALLSPSPQQLQEAYRDGHDDATRFIRQRVDC